MTVDILIGDVIDRLGELPDESVHCVVTSPPYWGLRDYDVDGQIGLEPTLGEHLDVMVKVFREVRRVLRRDGTLWLNYGDCYATAPNGRSAAATKAAGGDDRAFRDKPFSTVGPIYDQSGGARGGGARGGKETAHHGDTIPRGRVVSGGDLKPKDLCMMANRLAIALQEDGWYVRAENVWAKPNPMPESAQDRPGQAHEKVWLLSRSERYFYDAQAVRMPGASTHDGGFVNGWAVGDVPHTAVAHNKGDRKIRSAEKKSAARPPGTRAHTGLTSAAEKRRGSTPRHVGHIEHTALDDAPRGLGRNLRSYEPAPLEVWVIATRPFPEAHFATFPPELAERCIAAGCPLGGTVLDPFGGSGTVGLVADRMERDAVLIELNPEYAEMARRRVGLVADTPLDRLKRKASDEPVGPLFREGAL